MDSNLSVFFTASGTYFTVVKRGERGLELNHYSRTAAVFNSSNITDSEMNRQLDILFAELEKKDIKIDRISVSLPSESAIIAQFPGREGISQGELIQLMNLEIRQIDANLKSDDFTSSLFKLYSVKRKYDLILAMMFYKNEIEKIRKLFKPFRLQPELIEISQLNAHNSLYYNYPELGRENNAVFGIHADYIELSLMSGSNFVYYNHLALPANDAFPSMVKSEYEKLTKSYIDSIDNIFFWGEGLKKEYIDMTKLTLEGNVKNVSRLNSFRMMSSTLPENERDYCVRIGHIITPCIGAVLPVYHEHFILA